ncbi:hypothetical protein FACS1894190_08170 [Spirochaetia bacterium]|nr:hypothetical protein FACS1894190_08170 [Spirochaetia bacterium]
MTESLTEAISAMTTKAEIFYHDIGDYLNREEKLAIVKKFGSITNVDWQTLRPNESGDWINQRNDLFDTFIPLAPEKKFDTNAQTFFSTIAIGVATNRDVWAYNFCRKALENNMQRMIDFYNEQCSEFENEKKKNSDLVIEDFIDTDAKKISWTVNLKNDVSRNSPHNFDNKNTISGIYRPFCKQYLYYDRHFIERPGIWQKIFPASKYENFVIGISGIGSSKDFSTLIANTISCLDLVDKTQFLPLYYYEENKNQAKSLFDTNTEYTRRDGVSDFILSQARTRYGKTVIKEDIFYYVYGFLHSPDYREKFVNDLKKMLPRLPLVDTVKDFHAFSKAGCTLAELHLNYETVPPHPDVKIEVSGVGGISETRNLTPDTFFVEKMRFPAKGQKDTIIYNSKITVSNIPAKAYEYVVNGKSAIEWIMECYHVKTDKDSGIKNDPNDWATEHGKPSYILDLLLSVINVSVQTVDMVKGLPKVEWEVTPKGDN